MAAGKETSYSKIDENEIDLITIAATDFCSKIQEKMLSLFWKKMKRLKNNVNALKRLL